MQNTDAFTTLLGSVQALVAESTDRAATLQAVCQLLHDRVPHYQWVGFYLTDPDHERELVLGPFVGAPTEHVRIPFGRGICGQAAEQERTFIVQDVLAETNYLSCSPAVRSEIVVPLFKEGRVIGELDIDSHRLAPFTDADRAFLEQVCTLVATLFE